MVPGGPIDCSEVLKLWPAEPIRTSRANTCGTQAYLFRCELECYAHNHSSWGGPFKCVENGDTKGSNETDAKSTDSTPNTYGQACAVDSGKH